MKKFLFASFVLVSMSSVSFAVGTGSCGGTPCQSFNGPGTNVCDTPSCVTCTCHPNETEANSLQAGGKGKPSIGGKVAPKVKPRQ